MKSKPVKPFREGPLGGECGHARRADAPPRRLRTRLEAVKERHLCPSARRFEGAQSIEAPVHIAPVGADLQALTATRLPLTRDPTHPTTVVGGS
jgi:hypothetical protein